MRVIAFAWLISMTAIGACAQEPSQAVAGSGSCALMVKNGNQFAQTPLPNFDPSLLSVPLQVPKQDLKAALVICHRQSIIPEITDYRVLTEMHLPFAIKDGRITLFLVINSGQLGIVFPDGQASPEDMVKLQSRVNEMQTAIQSHSSTN